MRVVIKYNDSFDNNDCVEKFDVPEFTGQCIAAAMQEKLRDDTGLMHVYTNKLFAIVDDRNAIAVFHIVYEEFDSRVTSHLTGTAFRL
jgi:hypothetical protein